MDESTARLWRAYQRNRSENNRNELVLAYRGLVPFVAAQFRDVPSSLRDDLQSWASIGLIQAVERFDQGRDAKFETFAIPRMRGAIQDGLRSIDWVSRSARTKRRQLSARRDHLVLEYGREPTTEELAASLGWHADDVLAAAATPTLSMSVDEQISEDSTLGEMLADAPGDWLTGEVMPDDASADLYEALRALSDDEHLVVALYYFHPLTFSQIATLTGIPESRVHQLHTSALTLLRDGLSSSLCM